VSIGQYPLPLASEARMASSTFEAAAGLAGVPFAAAGRRLDAARGQRFGDFTQRHAAPFSGGVDIEQHIGGVGIGARRARSGWPRRDPSLLISRVGNRSAWFA